jgi:hypothetical protein
MCLEYSTRQDTLFIVDKPSEKLIMGMLLHPSFFPHGFTYDKRQKCITIIYNYSTKGVEYDKRKFIPLSKLIMGLNVYSKKSVIYLNNNVCDLRKENLRIATRKEFKEKKKGFFIGKCV